MNRDQKKIEKLLSDFVITVTNKYGDSINTILLFGSAARGEWKCGVSDIDMIIEVKPGFRQEIGKFSEQILWKLDRKHKTKLKEVCRTKSGFLGEVLSSVKLYTPIEVVESGEIDWKNGALGGHLAPMGAIIPVSQFASKIKKEGKVLYGKNIIKEIKVKRKLTDYLKIFLIPPFLSFVSFIVSVFSPNRGVMLAVKSSLYSIDDTIFFMKLSDRGMKLRIMKAEMGELYGTRVFREAATIKKNPEVLDEWSYIDKLSFASWVFSSLVWNSYIMLAKGFWNRIRKK